MSLTMSATTESRRESEGQWAVETHGLTKRFGDNIAVNGVELLVPRGLRLRLPGAQRRRQDDPHPGAARADRRRCRHHAACSATPSPGIVPPPWPGSGRSSTSHGSTGT